LKVSAVKEKTQTKQRQIRKLGCVMLQCKTFQLIVLKK